MPNDCASEAFAEPLEQSTKGAVELAELVTLEQRSSGRALWEALAGDDCFALEQYLHAEQHYQNSKRYRLTALRHRKAIELLLNLPGAIDGTCD